MQELLLEELARRANSQMQTQHRSTLQYKDVGTAFPFSCEFGNIAFDSGMVNKDSLS